MHAVILFHTAMEMEKGQGSVSLSPSVQIIIISAAVCIVSSSLFFAVGLLCHRYYPKQKHLHNLESMQDRETECVAIELTENVAYSQVQLRILP